ncbi:hypothetical protein ACF0H5_019224 [Mactra antiquata]
MTAVEIILSTFTIVSLTFVIIRYLRRKHYPVNVSCWFCGEKTQVKYEYKNCWDCPSCEQYNGFDKSGGYNKPIAAQYDERLNDSVSCKKDEYLDGHDILCERCSQNQLLKIKQLANFEPYDERNYDYEVEAYERHLEKVYRLCLPCEIKVEEELRIQNEAIAKRQDYLDNYKSLIDDQGQDENILHSSYSDKSGYRKLLMSYILHTVAIVCAVLISGKEIELNGDQQWQKYLLFLHPVLLWIDLHVVTLSFVGLFCSIVAKFCLEMNRLHIIDAMNIPVWLLVLLSHIGYLPLYQTGSLYNICSLVTLCITSSVCLGMKRERRDLPNVRVTRMSLDGGNIFDSSSSVSPYDSVSQAGSRSYVEVEGQTRLDREVIPNEPDSTNDKNEEHYTQSVTKETRDCHSNVDDATSELNAFSLGEPPARNSSSDTGIFSTLPQSNSSSNLKNQSVSSNLWSRKQGRPLITPASFNHSSTPDRHRSSPLPKYGLFSTSSLESQSPSFLDRPSSPIQMSAFKPLLSTQRHSFTPERPPSPVVTSFGAPPFSNIPLQSDRLSQCSSTVYRSSANSFMKQSHYEHDSRNSKSKKRINMTELSDDDDDLSDMTSVSRQCPVDSTSNLSISRNHNVTVYTPWWRHPGLIGFVLGGSLVANMMILTQILWTNYT